MWACAILHNINSPPQRWPPIACVTLCLSVLLARAWSHPQLPLPISFVLPAHWVGGYLMNGGQIIRFWFLFQRKRKELRKEGEGEIQIERMSESETILNYCKWGKRERRDDGGSLGGKGAIPKLFEKFYYIIISFLMSRFSNFIYWWYIYIYIYTLYRNVACYFSGTRQMLLVINLILWCLLPPPFPHFLGFFQPYANQASCLAVTNCSQSQQETRAQTATSDRVCGPISAQSTSSSSSTSLGAIIGGVVGGVCLLLLLLLLLLWRRRKNKESKAVTSKSRGDIEACVWAIYIHVCLFITIMFFAPTNFSLCRCE